MDMKRFFLYAIVIAALALAGCGSDGNGGMTGMTDPGPTDAEKIETAQMEADEAVTAAQAAVDKAKALPHADDPDTAAQIMAAETALAAAQAAKAKADADGVTVADAEAAAAEAEEEQGKAEAAYAMAKTASDIAVGKANDARVAAATKAAATKMTAIMAEAAQGTDGTANDPDGTGLGGSDPDKDGTADATGEYTLTITRDHMATKVMIADANTDFDGVDAQSEPNDEPQFEKAMDMGMANGFAGSMHVRVNSDEDDVKVEEVVIVRTDIDAPKATPFAEVTGQGLNARDLDDTVDADSDGTATNDFTALTITAGDSDANLPKIKSSSFAASTDAVLTFDADNASTEDMDEAEEVMGTYNGAMGTYRCNGGADCTVTLDADGEITAIGDGWVFTPNEGATSDVPDAGYLYYGVWLQRTTEDGEVNYDEVETYFGAMGIAQTVDGSTASADAAQSGIGLVTGTAEYNGNATGVYAKNVTDSQGAITSATSGVFSALVNLKATFGGGDIGVNQQGSINGNVTDFVLEHDEENDWSVELKDADFVTRTTDGNPPTGWVNTFSGVTEGDSAADAGNWNGAFFGPAAVADGDDEGTDADPTAPGNVLGEFDAQFTDGAVAGAFGAKKQMMMEQ